MYPTDCITAQAAIDIANRNSNIIDGKITAFQMQRSPYMDTIDGGTLSNASEVLRSVVSEQAMPAMSLARPVFVASSAACNTGGGVDQVGTTEFSYSLGNARGRGPKICIKTTRTAFKDSYQAAVNTLNQNLKMVKEADVRANYLDYGGSKMIMDSTASFNQAFSGQINTIPGPNLGWPNRTPDSAPSFRSIEYTMTYMRETLNVQPWEDDSGGIFKFIGGQDVIQGFRDELDIREDIRYLTAGRYKMGEETITGYRFQGPYHGIAFGVDPKPLRFTTITNGVPTLINPLVAVNTTTGVAARPNPAWTSATYEIAFLFGQSSFERLTPSYPKVEGWSFPDKYVNKGLVPKILNDADCNLFEDNLVLLWELERAYKPIAPHAVCAMSFRRCSTALNLTPC